MTHQLIKPISSMSIYADGIDASDYVMKIAPAIRELVAETGDLLDVGAGAGQLGNALSNKQKQWVAIEPDAYMADRLSSYPHCTQVIMSGWEEVTELTHHTFDTVLAANMIAPQAAAVDFLKRCREWTRNTIVWIVPSQRGPKKICLTGCLLNKWLAEEQQTGYERVISQLAKADYPSHTLAVDWTFSYMAEDVDKVAAHLANQLGWELSDSRRGEMRDHLYQQAIKQPSGYLLKEPKQSSILIWTQQ